MADEAAAPAKVYAVERQVHAGRIYEPGDDVSHFPPLVRKIALESGVVSTTKPKAS